jgi:hypothetical protein
VCGLCRTYHRNGNLVGRNIGARFAPNVTLALKSFWMHPMTPPGDEAQLEACMSPFQDSANLDAK